MAQRPNFWAAGIPGVRPGLRAALVGGGAAAAAGSGAVVVWRHQHPSSHRDDLALQRVADGGAAALPRLKFSAAAIEAFAGAMGEVAQISLLYPLVRLCGAAGSHQQ
jgi:hypothetical protein